MFEQNIRDELLLIIDQENSSTNTPWPWDLPENYKYILVFAPPFGRRPQYNVPFDAGQKTAHYNPDASQKMAHYNVDAGQKTAQNLEENCNSQAILKVKK